MSRKDTKQVIVMRKDLNMRKGKMCAQAAHASMASITKRMKLEPFKQMDGCMLYSITIPKVISEWLESSFAKICVYVNSEEELLDVKDKALKAGVVCRLITDSGKTEFNGVPTKTCLSIGPDYCDKIDKITGDLPLL